MQDLEKLNNAIQDLEENSNKLKQYEDVYGKVKLLQDKISLTFSAVVDIKKNLETTSSLIAKNLESIQNEHKDNLAKYIKNQESLIKKINSIETQNNKFMKEFDAFKASKKIVCTMMNESYGFGKFRNKIWLTQSQNLDPAYQIGYHRLFLPLIECAKRKGTFNIIIKHTLEHIAKHRTIDIWKQKRGKRDYLGMIYRVIIEPICFISGKYLQLLPRLKF